MACAVPFAKRFGILSLVGICGPAAQAEVPELILTLGGCTTGYPKGATSTLGVLTGWFEP